MGPAAESGVDKKEKYEYILSANNHLLSNKIPTEEHKEF